MKMLGLIDPGDVTPSLIQTRPLQSNFSLEKGRFVIWFTENIRA